MIAVVRWYLSAFHGGNRTLAKKPYNPIIGEIFRCHFKVPGQTDGELRAVTLFKVASVAGGCEYAKGGPCPTANDSDLTFIAEQVSHHPPGEAFFKENNIFKCLLIVSAVYVEHPASQIQCVGHIWTKGTFLGLSIGVHMVGNMRISLLKLDEHYTVTFPTGYGRCALVCI